MKNGVMVAAVVLSVASFAGMLRLKTDVESLVRERQHLADQRLSLRENRRVLQAELAYLSQPSTLMDFVRKHQYVEMDMSNLETLAPMGPAAPSPTATLGGGDAQVVR
jgi:hypothetical protein